MPDLDSESLYKALLAKDSRFDGRWREAVHADGTPAVRRLHPLIPPGAPGALPRGGGRVPRGGGRVDDRRRHARIARRNVQLPHVHDGLDVKSPFHSSSSR